MTLVGGGLCALASVVIAGRFFGFKRLVTIIADGAPMAFPTAALFFVCGVAFIAHARGASHLGRKLGGLVALVALGAVAVYFFAERFGLRVFAYDMSGVGLRGRMSPNTIVSFVALGWALFLMEAQPLKTRGLVALAATLLVVSFLALTGYLMGVRRVLSLWQYTGMAVHGGAGFLAGGLLILTYALRSASPADRPVARSLPFFGTAGGMIVAVGLVSLTISSEQHDLQRGARNALETTVAVERLVSLVAQSDNPQGAGGEEDGRDGQKKMREQIQTLAQLVADRPSQLRRVQNLDILLTEPATRGIAFGNNAENTEKFFTLTGAIRAEAARLLSQRQIDSDRMERISRSVLGWGVAISGGFLAIAFVHVYRTQRALQKMNLQLEQRVEERTRDYELSNHSRLESERSSRFLADMMPQLVWTARPDGTMESVNRRWSEFLGVGEAEALAATKQVIHPDDRAATRTEWVGMMRENRAGGGEYRLRRGDGTWRWHLWRAHPERDGNGGRIFRWVGTSTDIHDQKAATSNLEQSVRERTADLVTSESRQRETAEALQRVTTMQQAILNGASHMIGAVDRHGLLQMWNRVAAENLGWDAEEVVSRHAPALFILPEELAEAATSLSRVTGRTIAASEVLFEQVRRSEVFEREWTFVRKNRTQFPARLSVTALRNQAGEMIGLVLVASDLTASKTTAEELHLSRERLSSIFTSLAEGVLLQDADARILECNAAAERILGLPRDQMAGRTALDPRWCWVREDGSAFPGEEHPSVVTLRTGESQRNVVMGVHKPNGTRTWITINSEAVRRPDGVVSAVVCSFADVTHRMAQEAALRESEERFRLIVANVQDYAIFMLDPEGRVATWNVGAERNEGYTAAEIIGRHFSVFYPAQEVTAGEPTRALARAAANGREEREGWRVRKDGSRFWANVVITALRTPKGELLGFSKITRNTTESRRAEAALRESEERFRNSFELAGIGMALMGLDGRWLRVNRTLADIVGYEPEELLKKTFHEITHPDDLAADVAHVRSLLSGARRYYRMEKRYIHREGQIVWINLTASLVRDASGSPVHFVAQIEDITQRRQLEASLAKARDQALEASRLKSEFLATMSHEIRTPMNGIIGMSSLLMESTLTDDQREIGRVVLNSAESLLAIINDILDFSKIEAGKIRIDAAEFDLRVVVDETLALLAPRAQGKRIRLGCTFEPKMATALVGDAGRIRQVLTNFVGNAIKFTEVGEVAVDVTELRSTATHTRFRVTVRDTGIGISPAAQDKLFQPFTQVDGTSTRRFGGTGLGLAISRQITEFMGGEVGFESKPNVGSSFWFELELARGQSVSATGTTAPHPSVSMEVKSIPAPAAPATVAANGGLKLLLAEDNQANQIVAQKLLAKMGHRVDIVDNGVQALERLAHEPYDAVLMDCQMPVLDGYETTRRIRAGAVPGLDVRIPIIALTAYALLDDRLKCLKAGMNDYVSKPVRPENLRAALMRNGLVMDAKLSTTTAPVASGAVVLDERVLEQLRGLPGRNGPALLPELVAMFGREEPVRLAECERWYNERRSQPLADAAHTLAGSCANLGAHEMRAAALAVEKAAQAAAWEDVSRLLAELHPASRRLHDALKRMDGAS
jgi:PAS domain S-box-containing protein